MTDQNALSLHTRQDIYSKASSMVKWPVRLEKLMIPKLRQDSIQHSMDGGYVYVSEGITAQNPNAVLNRQRYPDSNDYDPIKVNKAFAEAYQTQGVLELGSTVADYVSTTSSGGKAPVDEVKDDGSEMWKAMYENVFGTAGCEGSQPTACDLNKQSKTDIEKMYGSAFSGENPDTDVVSFLEMPQYPYTNLNVYFATGGRQLESGRGASTRAFEDQLKNRSVEIAKAIGNTSASKEGQTKITGGTKLNAGKPFNASLFMAQTGGTGGGEETSIDNQGRGWRLLIFEWAPLIGEEEEEESGTKKKKNVWPPVPTPDGKNSFVESRLNKLRYYVGVAMLLDSSNVQQYYAWAPDNVSDFKQQFIEFHASVISSSLGPMERFRIDTFDPLSMFSTEDQQVVRTMVYDVNPLSPIARAHDMFDVGRFTPDPEQINGILTATSLPIDITRDSKKIVLNLGKLSTADWLAFMESLPASDPESPNVDGYNSGTIWAWNVVAGQPPDTKETGNTITIEGTTREKLGERFKVHTKTDKRGMNRIVHPVVLRAFRELEKRIKGMGGMDAVKASQVHREQVQEFFNNLFRAEGNLYIQHIVGDMLNKALSMQWNALAGQDERQRRVNVYRQVAQRLIDGTAFSHCLGRLECLYVLYRDVICRLIVLATLGGDTATAKNLRQVAYAICIYHPLVGVSVEEFRKTVAQMSDNARTLRATAVERIGECKKLLLPSSQMCGYTKATDSDDPDEKESYIKWKRLLKGKETAIDTYPGTLNIPEYSPAGNKDSATMIRVDANAPDFLSNVQRKTLLESKIRVGENALRPVGDGITIPNLWHVFDYWAFVLLDQTYHERHTKGLAIAAAADDTQRNLMALGLLDNSKVTAEMQKLARQRAELLVAGSDKDGDAIGTQRMANQATRRPQLSARQPMYAREANQQAKARKDQLGI